MRAFPGKVRSYSGLLCNANVRPRAAKTHPKAALTTEDFISDVIADVKSRTTLVPIYALAWPSGGPPTYAMTLRENSPIAGAFIAMSVFYPAEFSSPKATGRRFYLLQSPDDRMTRFEHAQKAEEFLSAVGARVHLQSYAGGHGWRGPVWQMMRDGIRWLETTQPD